MSVFMLETGAVQSAADSLNSIVSELDSISSSVSGYDTSQEGEEHFDFDGAKSVIAENIKAASIKVQNTASVMNTVVESHTNLQNSMKYGEDAKSEDASATSKKTGSNNSGSNGGYYPSSSGGGNSGGSSGGHSGGGGTYIPISNSSKKDKKNKDKEEVEQANVTGILAVSKDQYVTDDSKKKLVSSALAGILLAPIAKTIGAEALKEFGKSYDINYTKEGFAKVGDRYVISCDESYGKVGDMIDIKQKDNSYVKCIIGSTDKKADEYKNNVSFLTKDEVKDEKLIASTDNIKKNTTHIYNAGEDTKHKKATAPTTQEQQTNAEHANSTNTANEQKTNAEHANSTNTANEQTTNAENANSTNANNTNNNTNTNTSTDSGTNQTETNTQENNNPKPEFPEDQQVAV